MDQDPISQNQNQNQGFWAKNRNYLIVAGIIAAVAIVYFTTRDNAPGEQQIEEGQTNEQVSGENTNPSGQEDNNQNQTPPAGVAAETAGNVSATRKLRPSDDLSKRKLILPNQTPTN